MRVLLLLLQPSPAQASTATPRPCSAPRTRTAPWRTAWPTLGRRRRRSCRHLCLGPCRHCSAGECPLGKSPPLHALKAPHFRWTVSLFSLDFIFSFFAFPNPLLFHFEQWFNCSSMNLTICIICWTVWFQQMLSLVVTTGCFTGPNHFLPPVSWPAWLEWLGLTHGTVGLALCQLGAPGCDSTLSCTPAHGASATLLLWELLFQLSARSRKLNVKVY